MQRPAQESNLSSARSLIVSAVLLALPPILYFVGTQDSTKTAALVCEALFWLTLSLLFYAANRLSESIALFAAIRWLCESWATFARAYRTRFFGTLALIAFVAVPFELATGSKVTHYFQGHS
jgi:hypothetical protein